MISTSQFTGIIPKVDSTKLPDNAATVAIDCDFTGGRISGLPVPTDLGPEFPCAAAGFVHIDSDNTTRFYTLPYDADFVRSPVQQDDHKRIYWTGKNGANTEFRFARVGDNISSGTPSVSYKVGVAQFVSSDVAMNNAIDINGVAVDGFSVDEQASAIGGYMTVSSAPPVEWSSLTDVKNSIHLVDEDGKSIKDITGDMVSSEEVGPSYRGWFNQYKFTLSKTLTEYTQTSVTGTQYAQKTMRVGVSNVSCNADVWYSVTYSSDGSPIYTLRYIELQGGSVVGDEGESLVGKYVSIYTEDMKSVLGRACVLTETKLSSNGSVFPDELSSAPSVSSVVRSSYATARIAFFCTVTLNGVTATAKFIQNETLTDAWSVDSTISGGITQGSTDYEWLLNLRFGEDLGLESRAYVFTFVNRLGEESAPFGVTELTLNSGSERVKFFINSSRWESKFDSMQTGRYKLHGIRVYRTAVGGTASAMYFYVGTVTTSAETFVLPGEVYLDRFGYEGASYVFHDSKKSAELGSACTTIDFISDVSELQKLQGLTTLYNGILAAFKDNEVWYCEPYMPWAWKRANVHTLAHKVVALLPSEQGVYVLTDNCPYYVSGQTPDSMVPTKLPGQYPCIDKRSAATVSGKNIYISGDGPVIIDGGNVSIDTMAFNRDTWRSEASSHMSYSGRVGLMAYGHRFIIYITAPSVGVGGYLVDLDTKAWTRISTPIMNAIIAPPRTGNSWTDNLVYSTGSGNWMVFGASDQTSLWSWASKDFILQKPTNFGAIQLYGKGVVKVTIWADDIQIFLETISLSDGGVVSRLPSGFIAPKWRVRFDAQESLTELRAFNMAVRISDFANV